MNAIQAYSALKKRDDEVAEIQASKQEEVESSDSDDDDTLLDKREKKAKIKKFQGTGLNEKKLKKLV